MCRLMAYFGPEILVAEVVLYPSRSIIKQSYDAKERLNDDSLPLHLRYGNLNGDGFGIGWYPTSVGSQEEKTPCTFTSVTPAWNNLNLGRLARKLESGLIFAHVRAAYPGMPVSEQNCHPFAYGKYLFMHNGVVAGFLNIRRKILATLSEEAFNSVESFTSDSSICFSVFLDKLPNMEELHSPEVLLRAIHETITTIRSIQDEAGITGVSLLNFVVSDGQNLIATRYVSNGDCQPASLYFSEGISYCRADADDDLEAAKTAARAEAATAVVRAAGGVAGATGARAEAFTGEADYHLRYSGTATKVCMIASEPVTSALDDWAEVPKNTALVISRDLDGQLTILRAPLIDSENIKGQEIFKCLESTNSNRGHSGVSHKIANAFHFQTHGRQPSNPISVREARFDTTDAGAAKISSSYGSLGSFGADEDHAFSEKDFSVAHLTGHTAEVVSCAVYGDMLFSGALDKKIKVWCLREGKYLRTLAGHQSPIRQIRIISSNTLDSHSILISAGAKTLRFWSLKDLKCIGKIRVGTTFGSIKAVAASPSNIGVVYVGGQDCTIRAYEMPQKGDINDNLLSDVDKNAATPLLSSESAYDHCGNITSLAIAGEVIFSGGADSTIRAWDLETLKHIRTMRGHRGSVLTLSTVSGLLLSGGRDHLIRVWDIETMVCRKTLRGHEDDILCIQALDDHVHEKIDNNLGCGDGLHVSSFLEVDPGSPRMALDSAVLFCSCSADGTLRIWDAKTFHCLQVFRCYTEAWEPGYEVMSCSLASSHAIAGMPDGRITLFDIEDIYSCLTSSHLGQDHTARQYFSRTDDKNYVNLREEKNETIKLDRRQSLNSLQKASQLHDLNREFERSLRVFIRIPTVSADPSKTEDSFRGAKFLLRLLDSLGAEVKLVQPVEGKNPVVLGRIGTDSSLPTITCYAHYDVQPAMEPEWRSDPFEMQDIDGYFIGRGVSDNKGPLLAFVYAVKELLEESEFHLNIERNKSSGNDVKDSSFEFQDLRLGNGETISGASKILKHLPVNVVFLFEGEEENGSIGFHQAVNHNLHWFEGTKVVLISNTLWVGENRPCLTYGMRGMLTMSVEITGAIKDLHSGNEGGVFSEPLADLTKILSSLVDSRSTICVPGFYDDVCPDMLTPAMERLQTSSEFSLDGYRKAIGVQELTAGRSEVELLTARWCQPSLSIVDVRVGTTDEAGNAHYRFGPTRFSVIPRAAVGKISVRFVPNQDAKKLTEHLTAHIHHEFAKLRSGNSISVRLHSMGDWWEAEPQSKLMRIAESAIENVWNETPLLVREGGTMPVSRALEKMLDAPALLVPMGQASDNCHLANERMRRINLFRGKNVIKNIMQGVGESFSEDSL